VPSPPRCGILLPTFDPLGSGGAWEVAPAARLAEELGFDALWAGDHLACPAPGLDAVGCLSAAAVLTERIGLGLSVMLLGLRAPAWAAKQLVTIDALAGGRRLALGVGVGGEFPEEFQAAGVPLARRGARLDDALTVIGDLMAGRPIDHRGATMEVTAPSLAPAIAQPPPIYVGGRGEPAMRRAVRFGDAWLPMWLSPQRLAERAARLAELAAQADRPRPGLALLVLVRIDDDRAAARREADAHIRGQYRMALQTIEHWAVLDSIDGAVQRLGAYEEAGVEELLLLPMGSRPLTQYERLAEVRARLRGLVAGRTAR